MADLLRRAIRRDRLRGDHDRDDAGRHGQSRRYCAPRLDLSAEDRSARFIIFVHERHASSVCRLKTLSVSRGCQGPVIGVLRPKMGGNLMEEFRIYNYLTLFARDDGIFNKHW